MKFSRLSGKRRLTFVAVNHSSVETINCSAAETKTASKIMIPALLSPFKTKHKILIKIMNHERTAQSDLELMVFISRTTDVYS